MQKTPYNAPAAFDWVEALDSWHLSENVLHVAVRTAGDEVAQLTFSAVTPAVWRMTFIPPGGHLLPTPILLEPPQAAIALDVTETDSELNAAGPTLTLHLQKSPWALRLLDENGFDVFRENPSDVDGLGRPFVLPLGFVRGENGPPLVSESFHLRQDEHLYGLGEKFTPLDKVGQRIITWTQDAFGSTSERSHKNIPFLLSTRGYGLLLDSGARVTWQLGTESSQSATLLAESSALDFYIIHGPTPAEILERYTALTGRSPLPPKWSFGLWLSGTGAYRDQAAIEKLVAELEAHDFPADVIHVDTWWMKWRLYCDFQWDRDNYPDVEGFIAGLHERGYKLSLWEHPYISVESELFDIGRQNGYFLRRPDGDIYVIDYGLSLAPRPDGIIRIATPETAWNARVAIVDFTNPAAYTWFQDLHRPVLRMGVDVFKTDFGEDVPHDALFHNGETGATQHNLYPLLYNRAVYEVTEQERGYGMVWSRSGTAGSQRYPVCWSGDPAADFDSLACTIRGGLSIGLSGVPFWSSDIGAYRNLPSPRLYVRWAQFGLFSSHSRMHGDSPRQPWYFGEEATAIVRKYVNLRYQLFPYLYSAAHEAAQSGMPVIRAMPLAFPQDANAHDKDLQYLFGPSLLVAPVYDESDQRSVYLPAGEWVDYWTGAVLAGPVNIRVDAPLDTLPLFVRRGAVIAAMPPAKRIPERLIDPLIVNVYPAATIAGRLYEDEGVTEFYGAQSDSDLTFGWRGQQQRAWLVRFIGLEGVATVQLALNEGDTFSHPDWCISDDGTVEIQVPKTASVFVIRLLKS